MAVRERRMKLFFAFVLFAPIWTFHPAYSQNEASDVADIPSQDLRAGGEEKKRYFLVGPHENAKPPAEGWKLLIVLPGGDGSAEFHPFVKRIFKNSVPRDYLLAQPVAVKWTESQKIIWPSKKIEVAKMEFSTEEFVEAVIADVAKKQKIDRRYIFTLSWSSSGPVSYAMGLADKPMVTGSYIAMSVFKPEIVDSIKNAKGRTFFLDHSPEDKTCSFRFAEEARDAIKKNGGKVELVTYEGGHGWHGDMFVRMEKGIRWLEKNAAAPAKAASKGKAQSSD